MCFDRLTDEETKTASVAELLGAEWACALRNGAMAATIVLAVLLFEGAPLWVLGVSVLGAVVLGTLLHQAVLLAGLGVVRARGRWQQATARTRT